MLNYTGTVAIETEHLVLRRFCREDCDAMFRNWASDAEVCRFMRWQPHKSSQETSTVLNRWIQNYEHPAFYQWAITKKESDEPLGAIALNIVNEFDECGDVAYCLGRNFWGQGIVSEALKAVLLFAFETIGFNRIEAYHSVGNPASGKVMEKAGMVCEGLSRQKYRSTAGFEDCKLYAVLEEDFK